MAQIANLQAAVDEAKIALEHWRSGKWLDGDGYSLPNKWLAKYGDKDSEPSKAEDLLQQWTIKRGIK